MFKIFVQISNGTPDFDRSGRFEFLSVPRIGEEIVVVIDGDENRAKVRNVINIAKPVGDRINPLYFIHLDCVSLDCWTRG